MFATVGESAIGNHHADVQAERSGVDRSHAVPLYHQIFLLLRDEIVAGALPHGASVPTEQDLEARHGVSRVTARRALVELAAQGFVERRRRTGTRVIHQAPTHMIEANIDQAVESLLAFGRETRVRVVTVETVRADVEVARKLGVPLDDPVVRTVRVRLLDDEPLGEIVSLMPASLGLTLRREDLATTPMLALLRAGGHTIGGGHQTISAGSAGARLAALLGIDVRAPVLSVERTVFDAAGMALLTTTATYRADRYRIRIDLQPADRAIAE